MVGLDPIPPFRVAVVAVVVEVAGVGVVIPRVVHQLLADLQPRHHLQLGLIDN